jgi:alkylhydroperoxidase/carboxymuconolactone decarboxylase family protein YurZ
MRLFAASLLSFCLIVNGTANGEQTTIERRTSMSKSEDVRFVAPALEKYAQEVILSDLWERPGLSPRDRGIITIAAMIARNQTAELPFYLSRALDSGVKPAEISEIITWRSIPAGRTRWTRSRSRGASSRVATSGLISSRRHRDRSFLSTRLRRSSGRRGLKSNLARSRQVSSSIRPTCCSEISG